jgi:phage/plasmid-associated DNA primase
VVLRNDLPVVYFSASKMASSSDSKRTDQVQKALLDLMKGCRANGDQNYTHNAQVAPKGKFFVTNQQVYPMYSALCELVSLGGVCGLMEKDGDRMPVIADNDFDFAPDEKTPETPPNVYEPFVVMEEIKSYQEGLKQYFQVKNPKALICCVLEKPSGYMKKGLIHNGFHLHFPFANTDANDQQSTLYPFVKRTLEQRGVLEKMAYQDAKPEKWGKILDPGLPKKTWIMYGCRKDSTSSPYQVTAIYDHELKPLTVAEAFDPKELTFVKNNMLPLSFFEKHPPEYYLPIFLSVRAWDAFIPLKDEIKALLPSELARGKRTARAKITIAPAALGPGGAPLSVNTNAERAAQMKDVRVLAEMLNMQRADGYDSWMHVGWCLFNVSHGGSEGLALWIDFSKKSPKFEEGKCEELWETMTMGNYTIGSLRLWAQQDNPEGYKKWAATEQGSLMTKALSLTNYDVAHFIKKMYEDRFVCASLKHVMWYEFKNHRWRVTDKGASLYHKFSTEVVTRLDRYRTELSQAIESSRDDEEKDRLKDRIVKIGKLEGKLKDTTYKNKLMAELSVLFYDPFFIGRADNNPDLLVFKNGVMDFKLGEKRADRMPVLRPGVPEDYCTKCTGIDFPTNYTWDSPAVKEMQEYLRKVFPTATLREYFLYFAASTLRGGNPTKRLPQWYGEGDNSKSGVTKCFEEGYGDYCIKFPPTFFTGKSAGAGAATPEDDRSQGARIGFIQEPEGSDVLNISKVKERTGGDSFYARGLYKEGREIKNMLKYVMVCNKPLRLPNNERATQGRMELTPFLATFCRDKEDVPATEEEQYEKHMFLADPVFAEKIPGLAPAFMWLSWQYFPKFVAAGNRLPNCPEVIAATDEYRRDTDAYSHFRKEKIEARPNAKLKIPKLYKAFTAWWKINYPAIAVPIRQEMRDSINRLFKKPLNTEEWTGIDIKADDPVDMDNLLVDPTPAS